MGRKKKTNVAADVAAEENVDVVTDEAATEEAVDNTVYNFTPREISLEDVPKYIPVIDHYVVDGNNIRWYGFDRAFGFDKALPDVDYEDAYIGFISYESEDVRALDTADFGNETDLRYPAPVKNMPVELKNLVPGKIYLAHYHIFDDGIVWAGMCVAKNMPETEEEYGKRYSVFGSSEITPPSGYMTINEFVKGFCDEYYPEGPEREAGFASLTDGLYKLVRSTNN